MYSKVVVPLDGSKLAECVLPHVEALAKGCQVKEVVFLRVVEPFVMHGNAEISLSPEKMAELAADLKAEVQDYLGKLAGQTKYDGVKISGAMLEGRPADSLVDYATKNKADLFIIATHGRSGVSRWVFGSVAERILRSACIPVLMVRAPGCFPGI